MIFENLMLLLIRIAFRVSDWFGIVSVVCIFCVSLDVRPLLNKCVPVKIPEDENKCETIKYKVTYKTDAWRWIKKNKKWENYETIVDEWGAECVWKSTKGHIKLRGAYLIRPGGRLGIEYDEPIELLINRSSICKYGIFSTAP